MKEETMQKTTRRQARERTISDLRGIGVPSDLAPGVSDAD